MSDSSATVVRETLTAHSTCCYTASVSITAFLHGILNEG